MDGKALEVTNEHVRDLAIIKQGLDAKPGPAGRQAIIRSIRRIKLLQLDSINVVDRSHYLVIFSRLGHYDRRELDRLLYPDRKLFEQWSHAKCLIPIESYPYYEAEAKSNRGMKIGQDYFGHRPKVVLDGVMEKITRQGPMSSRDFEGTKRGKGSWWNRKKEKDAMELLLYQGYLTVHSRRNFQCYYDLAERAIPGEFTEKKRTVAEFKRWAVVSGMDALGIGTLRDISDYFRLKPAETRVVLEQLIKDGEATKIEVKGWDEDGYALSSDLAMIKRLVGKAPAFSRVTLLSPFDNLIWFRDRTERLFSFHFRVEMYTPKKSRKYGYYTMPILYGNRIVGRVDPKVDRKRGVLVINYIHLEGGIAPDAPLARKLAEAIGEFMKFNACTSISIGKTHPSELKVKIERAIKPHA